MAAETLQRFNDAARKVLLDAGVRPAQLDPPGSFWRGVADHLALALAAQVGPLREALEAARDALNIDRTGLAAGLNEVKRIAKGYRWLPNGEWGSYSWEHRSEETLRKEVGWMIDGLEKAADAALHASGDLADKSVRAITTALAGQPAQEDVKQALVKKGLDAADQTGEAISAAALRAVETRSGDVLFGPALRLAAGALEAGADEPFAAGPAAIEACAAMLRRAAEVADRRAQFAVSRALVPPEPFNAKARLRELSTVSAEDLRPAVVNAEARAEEAHRRLVRMEQELVQLRTENHALKAGKS